MELITRAIDSAADYTHVESLVEKFVKETVLNEKLKDFSAGEDLKMELISGDLLEKAGAELISQLLKGIIRVSDKAHKDARRQHTFTDLLDFLIVGFKPSIAAVTANILEQLTPEDVLITLMMDITKGTGRDRKLFEKQIADTSMQILRYPGRILPFFAINPIRQDFLVLMEKALNAQGFVGIKLYPSLGYDIACDEMSEVFRYCHLRQVPIMVHCSKGGFYSRESDRKRSEPKLWKPVLKKYPGLKVCFGHFGGGENLCRTSLVRTWTQQILDLMKIPENTGVYADVSFHSEPMRGGDQESCYFDHLRELLKDQLVGERILFGTDFWLVRMVLTENNYWRYFEETLNDKDLFIKATLTNPKRFIGIGETGKSALNIRNYIRFVIDNHAAANAAGAAQWLLDEIAIAGGPEFQAGKANAVSIWSPNNEAHVRMYRYLKANQMYPEDAQKLRFADCPYFPVFRLQYWNKEFESTSIFLRKCEAVAKGMDRYFRTNNAAYESGVEHDSAVPKLIGALADKGTVFYELARDCDELYRFKTEES